MDFELSKEQKMVIQAAREIAKDFGPEYWREKEEKEEFGQEFWDALRKANFQGIAIPEEYGGGGMGMLELAMAMEELAANGCGMGGAWYLTLTSVFGGVTITRHGSRRLKEKYLPKIASGEMEFCLAVTEPNAGSNTFNIETKAVKEGDEYVINGTKMFISGADRAKGMTLLVRTTPKEKAPKKTYGISVFIVELPNPAVEVTPIPKHGINYSKTCEVNINNLRVPEENLVGEKDQGWYIILDTLNPERISFAAAAVGIARLAISKAVEYSKQRRIFADPIGSYQGLQFPLAQSYAEVECARLMNYRAAWLFDNGKPYTEVGAATNMAKTVAIESGIKAVYNAMQVFGGYGYAKEYDVERWWREINLLRLAPITQQMALAYIGEHVLGMPKSYRTE
ncbi:MAG: acyl-CoA dehydrogenase family protein [Candidatus Nezhaarchaeales archaeon]